jgi:hypothetical protein
VNVRQREFCASSFLIKKESIPCAHTIQSSEYLELFHQGKGARFEMPLFASGAQVKNAWSSTSTAAYVFMVWCLIKHGDVSSFVLLKLLE